MHDALWKLALAVERLAGMIDEQINPHGNGARTRSSGRRP